MMQSDADRSSFGRTVLGGAAGGFTYDAAMLDAVAREERLRRPLRLKRWQDDKPADQPATGSTPKQSASERAVPAPAN